MPIDFRLVINLFLVCNLGIVHFPNFFSHSLLATLSLYTYYILHFFSFRLVQFYGHWYSFHFIQCACCLSWQLFTWFSSFLFSFFSHIYFLNTIPHLNWIRFLFLLTDFLFEKIKTKEEDSSSSFFFGFSLAVDLMVATKKINSRYDHHHHRHNHCAIIIYSLYFLYLFLTAASNSITRFSH